MLATSEKTAHSMGTGKPEFWIWLFGKHLPSQNLEPRVCKGTGKRGKVQVHGHYFNPAFSTVSPTSLQLKSL